MAISKKTYYGSGRFYTVKYDSSTFPMPADPEAITAAELTELKTFLADNMIEENQIGYLKNGYQFKVETNKLSDKSDLGEMKIDVVTEETATVAISLFNANSETIANQYPAAKKTTSADGFTVTTVGGLNDIDETPKVCIFKHDDNANGDTVVVCIGKNTSGFEAVWKQDSVTPFTVNYDVEPLNDDGRLAMFIDCPKGTDWDSLKTATA